VRVCHRYLRNRLKQLDYSLPKPITYRIPAADILTRYASGLFHYRDVIWGNIRQWATAKSNAPDPFPYREFFLTISKESMS